MNYLGIDYGEKRIGLSFADELGIAVPLEAATGKTLRERLEAIGHVIKERRIEAVVVGYPYNMDGTVGFKAREVDGFIEELKRVFDLPVYKIDERLSSHQVEMDMASLMMGAKKKSIKARQEARKTGDVDSRAAALILQDFLEGKREE